MGHRRQSRAAALMLLYKLELSGESLEETLDTFCAWAGHSDAKEFSLDLVSGTREHLFEIDSLIKKHSRNWSLKRINIVDKNILRMAIYELLYRGDIPYNATINEAVEIAKKFGSEDSSAFINGILDSIKKDIERKSA